MDELTEGFRDFIIMLLIGLVIIFFITSPSPNIDYEESGGCHNNVYYTR